MTRLRSSWPGYIGIQQRPLLLIRMPLAQKLGHIKGHHLTRAMLVARDESSKQRNESINTSTVAKY